MNLNEIEKNFEKLKKDIKISKNNSITDIKTLIKDNQDINEWLKNH